MVLDELIKHQVMLSHNQSTLNFHSYSPYPKLWSSPDIFYGLDIIFSRLSQLSLKFTIVVKITSKRDDNYEK